MPTYPNIQELLELAAGIRAGTPVNTMDQLPTGSIPMQENTDPLEMRFDNSDPGRYTPSMLDPEGKYIRDALEITPGTNITPVQVKNPNAPQPPATMEKRPGIPVFTTPYQHEGQYTPTPQPNTTAPPTDQPVQPQPTPATQPGTQAPTNTDVNSSYELYSKILQNTLGPSPELDKKKRNQLAMVAGINALGQALKQVVDYTGRVKHGAPINPQEDKLTPYLLSQYDQEMQNYLARKSQYDLQKTNTLQEAMKLAYGDKQAQDAYNRDLEKLARQQGFESAEQAKQRGWLTGEREGKQAWESGEGDKDRGWKTGEREGEQGWRSKESERQRRWQSIENELDRKAAKDRAGGSGSKFLEEIEKGWEVMDNKNGQVATLPKVMFWDVLTRELKGLNMTPDQMMNPDRMPSKGYNSTEEEAKAIVTNGWNKYYDPVYGSDGKQTGWLAKPEAGNVKTIWDFIPMDQAPQASDTTNSWW